MKYDWKKFLIKTSHSLPRPLWGYFKGIAKDRGVSADELLTEVIREFLIKNGVDVDAVMKEWIEKHLR